MADKEVVVMPTAQQVRDRIKELELMQGRAQDQPGDSPTTRSRNRSRREASAMLIKKARERLQSITAGAKGV